MILYFTPGGRLGNQFFQLAMMHTVARSNEICVTTRMEELLGVVEPGLRLLNIHAGLLYRLIDRLCVPAARLLARLRLVSSIIEGQDWSWRRKVGMFRRVTLIIGYFQNAELAQAGLHDRVHVRAPHVAAAKRALSSIPVEERKIFVHVRRTDYLSYTVLGKEDPTVPCHYYRKLIDACLEKDSRSFFIFLTDDADYVEREYAWLRRKYVSRNSPAVDFAIMTQCDDGILSNSSLSWWGAFFMKAPGSRWFPRFWLGWKSRAWYPPNIRPRFGEEVEIGTASGGPA